jgi:membrane protease YdiL (CAAX protease family)
LFYRTLGLQSARGLWRDVLFTTALALGAVVAVLVAALASRGSARLAHASLAFLIGFLLVQPVLEELLFRGVVQGWLRERRWGAVRLYGFSGSNWIASLLFVAAHLPAQPLAWSLAVFLPSLVFGCFRDRHDSLAPPMILHVVYNAAFFLWPLASDRLLRP